MTRPRSRTENLMCGAIAGGVVLLLLVGTSAGRSVRAGTAKSPRGGTPSVRIFTVAGVLSNWNGPTDHPRVATSTPIEAPGFVAAGPQGSFLVITGDKVERVGTDGLPVPVAGRGVPLSSAGFTGDGGRATAAQLSGPRSIVPLPGGGYAFVDVNNNRVREVTPNGVISTVAGDGEPSFSGDGGRATSAALYQPESVAVSTGGGFLIADTSNARVRRVWPDGHISTVAGNGLNGFAGDGGPATRAELSPSAVAGLPDGGFLIADQSDGRVRRVWPDGHISTVAGGGTADGDGRPAMGAQIAPTALAVLPDGGFLIADSCRVRRVWPDGDISTVAGNGQSGSSGDGGRRTR